MAKWTLPAEFVEAVRRDLVRRLRERIALSAKEAERLRRSVQRDVRAEQARRLAERPEACSEGYLCEVAEVAIRSRLLGVLSSREAGEVAGLPATRPVMGRV